MKNLFRISGIALVLLSIFLIHSCKKDKPTPPIISTTVTSAIIQTTATSGGNITSDGGATVTAKGVCWNTSASATVANSKTSDGTGTGIFTSSITGLTASTVYFVRAYATNSAGTAYGNEISYMTTAATVPIISTTVTSAITQTTATSGGNITSDGGATVTAKGVCWNTSASATVANSKTSDGTGTGIFTSSIASLTAGRVYYVRAYATNSVGTAYGNEISFTSTTATVPVLTTTEVSAIIQTTATSGGNITSDGGATVTAKGVCWNTSASATVANSKTSDGTGTGIFTSSITGLTASTVYFVRAYATNSAGTAYGNEISYMTTAATVPIISTTVTSAITQTTATSGGNITSDGGATVTAKGVCWNTSASATVANSKTSDGTGTGIFTSSIASLTAGRVYYVRAYATNSVGTAYGNEISFTSTTATVPVLTTTEVSAIIQTTATSGGNITSDGGATVTAMGVCWNTSASAT